ncbi:MAG: DNA repair exonuclease [Syntrophotaleaceae bacterium]
MIRILHTADLHLDAPFPGLGCRAARRQIDFLETFERIITAAIKNEVHLLAIAGDLFDHPRPSPLALGKVQAGLKRLADRGIRTVLLPGTHDNLVAGSSVYRQAEFPGAVLLDQPVQAAPVELTLAGHPVFLYGFAYRNFASQNALDGMQRRSEEGLHIGLLHGSREGSPEWNHRKKDLPFSMSMLKGWDLDYVALGHYHGFEILQEEGRIFGCYPGSPEGKRFGENGPRHCALVTVDPRTARVEPIAVNHRFLEEKELDLTGCTAMSEAVEKILPLANPNLLLRLTMTGTVEIPLDLAALESRCEGDFFYLELRDRTRLFDSAFVRQIEKEETVRGVFVRRTRELMARADGEQRLILDEAFREVLARFKVFAGGDS